MLEEIEGLLIDLDGTIFKGHTLIPDADQAIVQFQKLEKKLVFLSNRGNITRKTCLERLQEAGIDVSEDDIILSSTVTARFIRKYYPNGQVWVLGNKGLEEELINHDVRMASVPEHADFLVITLHDEVTYQDLNSAFKSARQGARIIATNSDKTYPNEEGHAIDVAGMLGAIEATTGRKTEIVIGKPSAFMVEAALERLGVPQDRCLVIGDSLESDIAMGNLQGMKTALVLTGSTSIEQIKGLRSRNKPDLIVDSIYDLCQNEGGNNG